MHWGRDRSRGPRLPLEHLIKRQTSETADFFSFSDRGRLAPGLRADINVIDFDNLKVLHWGCAFTPPPAPRFRVRRERAGRA